MKHPELEKAIKAKTVELELAMEFGKPKEELLRLYKQLKELHYQKVSLEQTESAEGKDLLV
jgi:hypothetical protein